MHAASGGGVVGAGGVKVGEKAFHRLSSVVFRKGQVTAEFPRVDSSDLSSDSPSLSIHGRRLILWRDERLARFDAADLLLLRLLLLPFVPCFGRSVALR